MQFAYALLPVQRFLGLLYSFPHFFPGIRRSLLKGVLRRSRPHTAVRVPLSHKLYHLSEPYCLFYTCDTDENASANASAIMSEH